jgi:YjgF/chorismate_mutase-like, putative endoribonuclease
VGVAVTLDQAYEAARNCALNHLAIMKAALGDLDRVERIVKVVGYVNVAPGFTDMPKVVNGESDLLVQLLGDRGQHARAAVGVASLSQDAPVETQSRWWLKSRRPHFLRRCSGHVFLAASRERMGAGSNGNQYAMRAFMT